MERNWCIKLDAENRDVVIQYLNEKYNVNLSDKRKYYALHNNEIKSELTLNEDYLLKIEITTEEFIKKIKSEGYEVVFDTDQNKYFILNNGYKSNILGTSKNNPPINKFLSELDKDTKEIKSDGGSTQYYQIEITNSKGEKFSCELNDILRDVFNNQWDLCNIVKASRRISESRKGQGKKDVSIQYDANKIIWFAEEIKKYE
jgi:hypothetical protein